MLKQHWKISLLVILFLPILVSLGFWQLDRAQEKRQALVVYQQQQELPVIPWAEAIKKSLTEERLHYRAVFVEGTFDEKHYWLLDNQPRMGKPGYEVIMPLLTDEGIFLVNRGWIQASQRREILPNFETPRGKVKVEGYLFPSQKNAVLKNTESDLGLDWPRRVLQLNVVEGITAIKKLHSEKESSVTNKASLLLRMNTTSPGALITDWPVINTKPEKHTGYAVQWFSMSVALLFLYGWFLYRTNNEAN